MRFSKINSIREQKYESYCFFMKKSSNFINFQSGNRVLEAAGEGGVPPQGRKTLSVLCIPDHEGHFWHATFWPNILHRFTVYLVLFQAFLYGSLESSIFMIFQLKKCAKASPRARKQAMPPQRSRHMLYKTLPRPMQALARYRTAFPTHFVASVRPLMLLVHLLMFTNTNIFCNIN